MIVRRLRLHPFAGISDGVYEFQPGVNVLFGPNEAGKSTLVHAIRTVLLEPIDYRKKKWEDELSRFVPSGGGDTFRVSVEMEQLGVPYQLCKQWGSIQKSELKLPNGQLISSSTDVEKRLEAILKLKQGTWDNVLFAHQNHLSETLARLEGDAPEKADLAGILRAAVMATDGISIEKLEKSIQERLSQLRCRWDEKLQRPEGSRGVQNPWKQGVGSILAAWYRKEMASVTLAAIDRYEHDLDQIVRQLEDKSKHRDELQAYIDRWGKVAKAVGERQGIEARLQLAKDKESKLKQIAMQWPQSEERKGNQEKESQRLEATVASLTEEFQRADKYLQQQSKREKLNRAISIQKELDEAKIANQSQRSITRSQLRELEKLFKAKESLLIGLEAGVLHVRLVMHNLRQLVVQKGAGPKVIIESSTDFSANGRITVGDEDFQLEVTSGQIDFQDMQSRLQEVSGLLSQKLSEFQVTDLEVARECVEKAEQRQDEIKSLEQRLQREVGGGSIELLQRGIDGQLSEPQRDLQTLQTHLSREQTARSQLLAEVAQLKSHIQAWTSQFCSFDGLQDSLLDAREERRKQEASLLALPAIPPELGSIEEFIAEYSSKDASLRQLKESTIPDLKEQKAKLGSGPELSRFECEEELKSANQDFEQQQARLRALVRIESVFGKLRTDLDGETLDPWLESLRSILKPLTDGFYVDIDTDTGKVSRVESTTLSYGLLSMGTKSCLGIALRLSMAEHFLKGSDGFLILDDPMVDLDLDRQKSTVKLLREFAGRYQVIVVTCHQQHAELLGGNRVNLPRVY